MLTPKEVILNVHTLQSYLKFRDANYVESEWHVGSKQLLRYPAYDASTVHLAS